MNGDANAEIADILSHWLKRKKYHLSYRVAGNIIKDRDGGGANDFDWGAGYCAHESYPYGAPGFPTPHFDLEFWVRLLR